MTDDCGDNSDEKNCDGYTMCDFEQKNLCSWKNSGQWSVVAPYQTNGPRRDHTTGLDYGSYVFLRGTANSKSTLESPIFLPTNFCEIRVFIYIFANSNSGEFNIYSRTSSLGGDRLLLSIRSSMGQSWQKRIVTLSETVPFQIIIEGVKSSDGSQIIAIDDTSFDKGCIADTSGVTLQTVTQTTISTTHNSCVQNSFLCPTNNQCIPSYKVCDFLKDCPDGSDESNCGTCDFEKSTCGWYDDGYSLEWVRKTGPSSNQIGPQVDHTLQNAAGSYYLTTRKNGDSDLFGLAFSPTLGAMSKNCKLSFWVHMGDSGIPDIFSDITLFISNFQDINEDFSFLTYIEGPLGKDWKQYRVNIGKKSAGYLIELYAYAQYSNFDDKFTEVALDDIVFENCADNVFVCDDGTLISETKACDFKNDCPDNSDEKNCGTCDFEASTCGWYDGGANMEWIRKKGPSANSFGPQVDHTLLSSFGSYLITNRKNNYDSYAAFLLSPAFGQLASTCTFTFWAHLGNTGLSLYPHQIDVYISNELDIFSDSFYIGSAFGPTGSDWKQYRLSVGARPAGFLIDLWGFNEYSPENNILTESAIDDIVFSNCAEYSPGPDETFDCGDGTFLSYTKVCDFIRDCSTGSDEKVCGNCDFEKSFCNWVDVSPSSLKWERGQAEAATGNTGPSVDHTFDNSSGYYAFVSSQNGNIVDYADLIVDKNLGPSGTTCEIEFYYHMKGKTDYLVLYIATNYETTLKTTFVFEYVGDAGDKWNRAVVTLGRIQQKFRLQFSAERYYVEPNNDIAIDDIKLFNCEFPEGLLFIFLIFYNHQKLK